MTHTFLRRSVAAVSTLALVAMLMPASLAAQATLTLTDVANTPLTNNNIAATTATDIRIAYSTTATNFASGDTVRFTIKNSAGSLVAGSLAAAAAPDTDSDSAGGSADGAFTFPSAGVALYTFTGANAGTTMAFDFKTPSLAADTYTITMSETKAGGSDEAIGVVQLNVGNDNQVTVTAVVEPILAMVLSNNAIDLGTLTPAAITESATDTAITIQTNGTGGYTLQAAATNFVNGSADQIAFTNRNAQAAGTSGFSIDGTITTDSATGDGVVALAGTGTGVTHDFAVANGAATIASANGTTDGDIITVNYAAAVSAVQPAGNYSTAVTYTITGSF